MATAKILSAFPRALKNVDLVSKVSNSLQKYGYGKSTLLATSLCSDELNRDLENDFARVYGSDYFVMGGLSGFPFVGVTGFGAMAAHIPEGGSCLIVYGPHVGVDQDGVVGKSERRGQSKSSTCCGSATAAAAAIYKGPEDEYDPVAPEYDPIDIEQDIVVTHLLPHAERLAQADDPSLELPFALFDAQKKMMDEIVAAGANSVPGESKIALLGGIQINTGPGTSDYFLTQTFEVRDNENALVADLMWNDPPSQ